MNIGKIISRKEALKSVRKIMEDAEEARRKSAQEEANRGIQIIDKVWIVGQSYTDSHPKAWEFVGVFTTKEKAIEACKTYRYFVTCLNVDEAAPDESIPMPNGFFPKGED